jgi:putative DNA-invertase from lambdoid prophage Rac
MDETNENQQGFLSGAKRVFVYARVSDPRQKSVPDQVADMKGYCEARGWTVVEEFSDVMTGSRDTRPGKVALMRRAHRTWVDIVLVWKLDRWSRNTLDCLGTLSELEARDVGFVSIMDGLDLTTPTGRAMMRMMAVFSELERDMIIQRVRAGVKKKRERMAKEGIPWGRPASARLKADRVKQLASEGMSRNKIAKATGISRASVGRILDSNP